MSVPRPFDAPRATSRKSSLVSNLNISMPHPPMIDSSVLAPAVTASSHASTDAGHPPYRSRRHADRRGMTLTEMLIAVTVTLVLIAALVNAFRVLSNELTDSRAILELAGQLRSSGETIRNDLRGVTVPVSPWVDPADGLGYFEYAEFAVVVDDPRRNDTMIGDLDDVLMFTARSTGKPFRGRVQTLAGGFRTIESPVAEIAIWTVLHDTNGNGLLDRDIAEYMTVHRRVLLVRPDLNDDGSRSFRPPGLIAGNNNLINWYTNNDLSVHVLSQWPRRQQPGRSLELRKSFRSLHRLRPHRPDHQYSASRVSVSDQPSLARNAYVRTGNFLGEDVLISDVVEFDIKAFDPQGLVYSDQMFHGGTGTVPLVPGDSAFETVLMADVTANGAGGFADPTNPTSGFLSRGTYVDLGYLITLGGSSRTGP
ncbi:MAG: prepilin-type N-terminal cleavage/methylation domain-containing protein [Pirellulaceae bacterium]